jgi:hypothetical protein
MTPALSRHRGNITSNSCNTFFSFDLTTNSSCILKRYCVKFMSSYSLCAPSNELKEIPEQVCIIIVLTCSMMMFGTVFEFILIYFYLKECFVPILCNQPQRYKTSHLIGNHGSTNQGFKYIPAIR